MAKYLVVLVIVCCGFSANSQNFEWAKQYSNEFFNHVVITEKSQLYATGNKILAAKLGDDGSVIWQKNFPSSYLNGAEMVISADSNIYVCGTFYGTNQIGDTTLKATIGEGFLAKLDMQGNLIWIRQSTSKNTTFNNLALDDDGNIFLAGTFSGSTFTFCGATLNNAGKDDAFIAQINKNGNIKLLHNVGSDGDDFIHDIKVLPNRILISGYYNGPGYIGENKLPVRDTKCGFLVTYNLSTFVASFLSADTSLFYREIKPFANSYFFTAAFKDEVNVAGNSFLNTGQNFITDGLIIKADNEFNPVWATQTKGTIPSTLCVNKNESIITGGNFYGQAEIDGRVFYNKGESDFFVAEYDPEGKLEWAVQPGGPNIDVLHLICADTAENVFYVLGAVQSGPAKMGNLFISGNFSGAPFLAKSGNQTVGFNRFFNLGTNISVYPNPAKNKISVNCTLQNLSGSYLTITDLNGKTKASSKITSQTTELNVNDLPSGVYIINIWAGNKMYNSLFQIIK